MNYLSKLRMFVEIFENMFKRFVRIFMRNAIRISITLPWALNRVATQLGE